MPKKLRICLTFAAVACATSLVANSTRYLDSYAEEARLFGVASATQSIDHDLDQRLKAPYYFAVGHQSYKTPGFGYDFADKKVGDFSVTYRPDASQDADKFGFMTNLWGHYADLDDSYSLKFYLKTEGATDVPNSWKVQLVDAQGRAAVGVLRGTNTQGAWKAFTLRLEDLQQDASFELDAIKLCEFQTEDFSKGVQVKFDFARFENDSGTVIGITDKTIDQRIAEQKATNEIRTQKAFEASAEKAHKPIISAFAMLYLNQDLAEANRIIREDCVEMVGLSLIHI